MEHSGWRSRLRRVWGWIDNADTAHSLYQFLVAYWPSAKALLAGVVTAGTAIYFALGQIPLWAAIPIGVSTGVLMLLAIEYFWEHRRPRVAVLSPREGDRVAERHLVSGTVKPAGADVQVFVFSRGGKWHLQVEPTVIGKAWNVDCQFGTNAPPGTKYKLIALAGRTVKTKTIATIPDGVPRSPIITVVRWDNAKQAPNVPAPNRPTDQASGTRPPILRHEPSVFADIREELKQRERERSAARIAAMPDRLETIRRLDELAVTMDDADNVCLGMLASPSYRPEADTEIEARLTSQYEHSDSRLRAVSPVAVEMADALLEALKYFRGATGYFHMAAGRPGQDYETARERIKEFRRHREEFKRLEVQVRRLLLGS